MISTTLTKNHSPASRRSRERAARFALIRRAGARVFAHRGFDSASMDMVAAEAELGKATLYYYFQTKQELFDDIIETAATIFGRRCEEIDWSELKPVEAVESVLRLAVEFMRCEPDLAILLIPLMASKSAISASMVGSSSTQPIDAVHHPLLNSLQAAARDLRGGEALVPLLVSFLVGLVSKLKHGCDERIEAEIELLVRLLRLSVPRERSRMTTGGEVSDVSGSD